MLKRASSKCLVDYQVGTETSYNVNLLKSNITGLSEDPGPPALVPPPPGDKKGAPSIFTRFFTSSKCSTEPYGSPAKLSSFASWHHLEPRQVFILSVLQFSTVNRNQKYIPEKVTAKIKLANICMALGASCLGSVACYYSSMRIYCVPMIYISWQTESLEVTVGLLSVMITMPCLI